MHYICNIRFTQPLYTPEAQLAAKYGESFEPDNTAGILFGFRTSRWHLRLCFGTLFLDGQLSQPITAPHSPLYQMWILVVQ